MTIANYTNDGHYPILIALCNASAGRGHLPKEDLIQLCTVSDAPKHVRSTLATWRSLGLFVDNENGEICLDARFAKKRNESLEEFTTRIPAMCRQLLFDVRHALPLWPADGKISDDGIGESGDFVRILAWTLAQDIYTFSFDAPWAVAEALESAQVSPGKFIIKNDTRWPGMHFWARYTGFASGESRCIDPTEAVRAELPEIFRGAKALSAGDFIRGLSARLPVLDFGGYRVEVENVLNDSVWRRPPNGQLSTSLSLALRRLQLDRTLVLDAPADGGKTFTLSGRNFRPWGNFSTVELRKKSR